MAPDICLMNASVEVDIGPTLTSFPLVSPDVVPCSHGVLPAGLPAELSQPRPRLRVPCCASRPALCPVPGLQEVGLIPETTCCPIPMFHLLILVYTHTFDDTYTHAHAFSHTHTHTYTHTHTCTHTHTQIHTHSLSHTHTCSNNYYSNSTSSVSVGGTSIGHTNSPSGTISSILSLLTKQMQTNTLPFDSW